MEQTNAERLDAILAKHAPKAVSYLKTHQVWPRTDQSGMDKLVDALSGNVSPKDVVAAHADRLMKNDGMSEKDAKKLAESIDAARRGAPYRKDAVVSGVRVSVTKDDGSVIAGTGATIGDALAQLEKG